MTEGEVKEILGCVDTALEVYRQNEGKLTASEIRTKSMLAVVRSELMDQFRKRNSMASDW